MEMLVRALKFGLFCLARLQAICLKLGNRPLESVPETQKRLDREASRFIRLRMHLDGTVQAEFRFHTTFRANPRCDLREC